MLWMHLNHNLDAEEAEREFNRARAESQQGQDGFIGDTRIPEDIRARSVEDSYSAFKLQHDAAMRGEGPIVWPEMYEQISNVRNRRNAKLQHEALYAEPVY